MQMPSVIKAQAFWATGDLQAVEPLLGNPGIDPAYAGVQALLQRRYAAAIEIFSSAVAAATKRGEPSDYEKFLLGLSQQRAGDVAAARATYQNWVQDLQRDLEKAAPDSYAAAETHATLGMAYAGLGEAASAIAEGEKAMAMHPTSKDPFQGPQIEDYMATSLRAAGRCRSRDSHSQAAAADTVWRVPITPACCDSIRCGIKSATIRAFRNWPQKRNRESKELRRRSKRRECLQSCGCLCRNQAGVALVFGLPGSSRPSEATKMLDFCVTLCVTRAA